LRSEDNSSGAGQPAIAAPLNGEPNDSLDAAKPTANPVGSGTD
jgi:hypothetical protein